MLNSFFDANFTFRVMKHIGSFHGEKAHFLFCPHYEAHSKDFFELWFIVWKGVYRDFVMVFVEF